jgi:uncharacterized membrane protein HdeD (DUF308 family)
MPEGIRMRLVLARNWWSLAIRGAAAILVGVITFAWPGITLTGLVFLFGAYALLDGIFSIAGMVKAARSHERWGALLLEGVAGLLAALVTIVWPAITAISLLYVIAAWALVTGALEIAAAMRLRKHVSGEWMLALSGVLSLGFGVLIVIFPIAGALAITFWVGAYCLIFGGVLVALAFRLRNWGRTLAGPSMAVPAH